jgi:chromate transporter
MIRLAELASVFLKIGALGFGGPFSLLAIMQKEVVESRKWMTAEDFAQSVGIGTLTPGPIFFAAAVFIGYRLRRAPGAIVCAFSTLLPSFILVIAISALYVEIEANPAVTAALNGIAAGVVGLLASVVLQSARSAIKGPLRGLLAGVTFVALVFVNADPVVLIIGAGLAGAWLLRPAQPAQVARG